MHFYHTSNNATTEHNNPCPRGHEQEEIFKKKYINFTWEEDVYGQHTTHDDVRRPIAIGHPIGSGDSQNEIKHFKAVWKFELKDYTAYFSERLDVNRKYVPAMFPSCIRL